MKSLIKILLTLFFLPSILSAQQFEQLHSNDSCSFRGLSTYQEDVVWASGSRGVVVKSMDAGKSWTAVSPKGYAELDFRSIQLIHAQEALIVSAGSPAVILRTTDGGSTWDEVFRDNRKEAFLDAIVLEDSLAYVIGDPSGGRFQLLKSSDYGAHWEDVSEEHPFLAAGGEAAFAASNGSLALKNGILMLGTGGTTANFFRRDEKNGHTEKIHCPILQGSASTGIFAIDFLDENIGVVVGGDYQNDSYRENNILRTTDGGKHWQPAATAVFG